MEPLKVQATGLPWYSRDTYNACRQMFVDGHKLPETFHEWLKKAQDLSAHLRAEGHTVVKAHIDPQAFPAWCAARGLDIDTAARQRFASECARDYVKKDMGDLSSH